MLDTACAPRTAGSIPVPAASPARERERVDVWVARLDASQPLAHLRALLDSGERAVANRFVRVRDAHAYVVRRAFVRTVVAGYARVPPASLRFVRGANGKPALAADERWSGASLELSVSSSDGVAVCAVGRTPLGVDVERTRGEIDWRAIAGRFFTPAEHAALERLGRRGFFTAWTLKEAIVKARGQTLAQLPGSDVSAALARGHAAIGGLNVRTLALGADLAAALAVAHPLPEVRVLAWSCASPATHMPVRGSPA